MTKDIKTLPGKKLADVPFLCLASLAGSGLSYLFCHLDQPRKPILFDYSFRRTTEQLRRDSFESFVAKGWVECSPLHPGQWFVTEKGRQIAIDEAERRLAALNSVAGFPSSAKDSFAYNVTIEALECMFLVDRNTLKRENGLTLSDRGAQLIAGERPTYKTFQEHWKCHYDPDGHAADEAAKRAEEEQAAEKQRRETAIYMEEFKARQAVTVAAARVREERANEVTALRQEVICLAKGCFLQSASYDDLMTKVEQLLGAEEKATEAA